MAYSSAHAPLPRADLYFIFLLPAISGNSQFLPKILISPLCLIHNLQRTLMPSGFREGPRHDRKRAFRKRLHTDEAHSGNWSPDTGEITRSCGSDSDPLRRDLRCIRKSPFKCF